ncbi:hypothetical protein D3C71_1673950 [compost metagenome]
MGLSFILEGVLYDEEKEKITTCVVDIVVKNKAALLKLCKVVLFSCSKKELLDLNESGVNCFRVNLTEESLLQLLSTFYGSLTVLNDGYTLESLTVGNGPRGYTIKWLDGVVHVFDKTSCGSVDINTLPFSMHLEKIQSIHFLVHVNISRNTLNSWLKYTV